MRARFAQAAECSPCVLLLRHVDALAQNAQVQESGKGTPMQDFISLTGVADRGLENLPS